MWKQLIKKGLAKFNIKISKINNSNRNFFYPVEATKRDIEIIDHILNPKDNRDPIKKNALSMVSVDRLWAVMQATKYIVKNNLKGDLVECGVWKGGCSLAMAMVLKDLKVNKKIFLFDTFMGMTEPTDYDKTCDDVSAKKKFEESQTSSQNKWCYASIEDVKEEFRKLNLENNVVFIKGDVLDTLNNEENIPNRISLLRLDTDWYESTKHEMRILFPRLQKNGILLIDDYGHWQGTRKAIEEYFSENSQYNNYLIWKTDFTGRGLIKN